MTLAQIAIPISFALYVLIAVSNARQRDWPMFIVWTGYSFSQLGFLWYEINKNQISGD